MSKRKNILPYSTLGTLIQTHTGKRVSRKAKEVAAEILEDLCEKICKKAQLLAEHKNRKTIKTEDVALAYKQLKVGKI